MLLQQVTELQNGALIRHRFVAKINTRERSQGARVVERFFRPRIGQLKPVLQKINADNPSLTPLRNFFFSKNSELINIYSKCDMAERAVVITLLSTLDPTNGDKYKQIGKN